MVFLLEAAMPEQLTNWLKLSVGVMLVGLGSDVLGKLYKVVFMFMFTNTLINLLMCMRIPIGEKSITKRWTITIHIQPLFPTGPYS